MYFALTFRWHHDPEFHKPSTIDILIGAEIFLKLLRVGQISLASDEVTLQNTFFGWIVGGKTSDISFPNVAKCNLSLNKIHKKISDFWEIENGPTEKILSTEENACEAHYQKTTTRDLESGKYIVRYPFKNDLIGLGESHSSALRRFNSLEQSFYKNPELKSMYITFIREYIGLGHMSEDESQSTLDGYFIPHLAVLKQSSLTTKLRTVFDASAKTSNGKSLNDILMVGPNIQEDIFSLLVRFRSHKFALTADIEKMYRQVLLHENDQKFQRILWRENSNEPIKIFKLKTVTYGTSPASFLATRTLVQLAKDEAISHPFAFTALTENFYMDDCLTGGQTFEETKQMVDELIHVTRKGGMNIRQWASNEPELINFLSTESDDSYICLNLDDKMKTLGVYWNPRPDTFVYAVKNSNVNAPVTKRTILSETAQLFDPLGLLGPVILQPKIIMQSLWQLNINWDEEVPREIATSWLELREQMSLYLKSQSNEK
ncbi:uncharacterized protein LOC127277936 [Leptopilina boulardi]|uniref:uncharacterized protein LOC127277936 n=1 Tax=Leptopilina boulardi TaxID=63433 RepID=UPI0021F55097|nr:uncharacterized protein LOC127277936 [Leptopilina boulardi]